MLYQSGKLKTKRYDDGRQMNVDREPVQLLDLDDYTSVKTLDLKAEQ